MKRLLAALFVLLIATPALAGMNIRQNSDGSTDWVDASGNAYNVGAAYLTVNLADVSSTNVSAAVTVPLTNAKITRVDATLHGVVTGNAVINVYAGTGLTSGSIGAATLVTNATDPITLTGAGSGAGTTDSLVPTSNNGVATGDAIIIVTDGGSANAIPATIVITVEPDGD